MSELLRWFCLAHLLYQFEELAYSEIWNSSPGMVLLVLFHSFMPTRFSFGIHELLVSKLLSQNYHSVDERMQTYANAGVLLSWDFLMRNDIENCRSTR